jgi:F-type H+-transporting ATPase subunit delta
MPKTTRPPTYAINYARSLLELATERNEAVPMAQDLAGLRQIVDENRSFQMFLADPGISIAERDQMIEHLFKGRVSPLLENFLRVLNSHGRLGAIVHVVDAYDELLDEQTGKIEVDLTVAHKLEPAQLEQVRQRVSQALKKDAVVHQYVDENIIGGLVIRVQDKLIDASVRTQLAALRQQLLSAK